MYKLKKLKEWGVQIDDCTWNSNKKECLRQLKTDTWGNPYWEAKDYYYFRFLCRNYNLMVRRGGYHPELK